MRPIVPTIGVLSSPQPKPARRALRPPRSRDADPHGTSTRRPADPEPHALPEPHEQADPDLPIPSPMRSRIPTAPERRAHPLPAPDGSRAPDSTASDWHPIGVSFLAGGEGEVNRVF